MEMSRISSPHLTSPGDASGPMVQVLVALVPGLVVTCWLFGWGSLIQVAWASLSALTFEAVALKARRRPVGFYLRDGSAVVTGVILGLAVPPLAPWWVTLVGVGFAIVIAKQFYGGLGYNLFNPAMAGYVVLLISFPLEMTTWVSPRDLLNGPLSPLHWDQTLRVVFLGHALPAVDGYTMATALDLLKQNNTLTFPQLAASQSAFGLIGGRQSEWVNLAYLVGGLYLLQRRVFTWHAPIGTLIALALMAGLFYDGTSAGGSGSPLFHLSSGAVMLGAFFIVTDPVTSAASNAGRLIYGLCIGLLIFTIRNWGNYPDAVAFSVLLMNFAAPIVDMFTQPRRFGSRHQTNPAKDTPK